ncbi:hypothetical protein C5167_031795 [Papaver somniferum]|uniref:Uncharacterized protein n=1 Tax=Papaver somniferum TaxID=3469 RepID=A0A4Y7K984_PAPSO|nr:hypothetical protein C5167_031795 [Papaver somniferum]
MEENERVPEPLIPPAGALEVLSLTDGLSKMSNSDPSDQSRRNLLDPKDFYLLLSQAECQTRFLAVSLTHG